MKCRGDEGHVPCQGDSIGPGLEAGALGMGRWVWLERRVRGETGKTAQVGRLLPSAERSRRPASLPSPFQCTDPLRIKDRAERLETIRKEDVYQIGKSRESN